MIHSGVRNLPLEDGVQKTVESIQQNVNTIQDLNEGEYRNRFLSLAITSLQEAQNWLWRFGIDHDFYLGYTPDDMAGENDPGREPAKGSSVCS